MPPTPPSELTNKPYSVAPTALAVSVEFLGLAKKQARALGQRHQAIVLVLLMFSAAHMEAVEVAVHQKSMKPLSI